MRQASYRTEDMVVIGRVEAHPVEGMVTLVEDYAEHRLWGYSDGGKDTRWHVAEADLSWREPA